MKARSATPTPTLSTPLLTQHQAQGTQKTQAPQHIKGEQNTWKIATNSYRQPVKNRTTKHNQIRRVDELKTKLAFRASNPWLQIREVNFFFESLCGIWASPI